MREWWNLKSGGSRHKIFSLTSDENGIPSDSKHKSHMNLVLSILARIESMSIKLYFDVWPAQCQCRRLMRFFKLFLNFDSKLEGISKKYSFSRNRIEMIEITPVMSREKPTYNVGIMKIHLYYNCTIYEMTFIYFKCSHQISCTYSVHCTPTTMYIQTVHNFQVKCADCAFNFYVTRLALCISHTAYCKVKVVCFFSTTHISIMFPIDGNFVLHKFEFMQPATIDLRFRLT